MRKKESEYRWIFFIVLAFLAPVFLVPEEIWYRVPGVRQLLSSLSKKENTGLWNSLNSADGSLASLNMGKPRGWMPPVVKSADGKKSPYGTAGGLIGEKNGVDYGEETDGVASEKNTDAGTLDRQGLGADGPIAGVPNSSENGAQGTNGSSGDEGAIYGMGEAGTMSPLPSMGNSSGFSGGSSAGGSSNGSGMNSAASRLASANSKGDGKGSLASNPLKRGENPVSGSRSGLNSTQADSAASGKTLLPSFGTGSQGQTLGETDGVSAGQSATGSGGLNSNTDPTAGGIGASKIEAPAPGPGKVADPNDQGKTEEELKADNCSNLYAKCNQITGDYDRRIQSKEAEYQNCYTWVDMGKSGWVRVVDQACFNRVTSQLQDLRSERDTAVKECQQGEDTCND
ncbi:MAG: hypothetical protein WCU88_03890 [Elusimicrobiota bacterium]|jgi:hypothetical protein